MTLFVSTEDKSKKKRRIPTWVWAVIIFTSLAINAVITSILTFQSSGGSNPESTDRFLFELLLFIPGVLVFILIIFFAWAAPFMRALRRLRERFPKKFCEFGLSGFTTFQEAQKFDSRTKRLKKWPKYSFLITVDVDRMMMYDRKLNKLLEIKAKNVGQLLVGEPFYAKARYVGLTIVRADGEASIQFALGRSSTYNFLPYRKKRLIEFAEWLRELWQVERPVHVR